MGGNDKWRAATSGSIDQWGAAPDEVRHGGVHHSELLAAVTLPGGH